MDPESLRCCVYPTYQKKTTFISLLISEARDKLALSTEREGELEEKGFQEGLESSTEEGELFLMQYTDIEGFGDCRKWFKKGTEIL